MESGTRPDKNTVLKSIFFVTGFWSLTALLFLGLIYLLNCVDISAIINPIS